MISLDTSCGRTSIALFSDVGEVLQHYVSPDVNNQSRELASKFRELTDGITIKKVFVCIGPGSFTGVRIGCAFASGLAASLFDASKRSESVIGFSSLELIAAADDESGARDVICKAGPHSYYKQKFLGVNAISEIEVVNTKEQLNGTLPDAVYAYKIYQHYLASGKVFQGIEPIYALPSYY